MRVQAKDEKAPNQFVTVEVEDERWHEINAGLVHGGVAAMCSIVPHGGSSYLGRPATVRDAQEAVAFLVSQLAYTEAKMYEKLAQPLQYQQLLPVSYAAGEWVDTIRYELFENIGQADDVSSQGDDVPEVDVIYGEKTLVVPLAGIGFSYTQEELRRTAYLRRPLSTARQTAAMRAYERFLNTVGLVGRSSKGLTGLFNNTSVTAANRPSGATWAASITANTPEKILADINYGILQVWTNTQYNSLADTIVVAPTAFTSLMAPRATGTDLSVIEWVQRNNLYTQRTGQRLNIVPGLGLDGAGAGSTNRAVFYEKSEDNLVYHLPMPLRFLAPQMRGLRVVVPGEFKYSGVEIRRTPTVYYMDGI